MATKAGRTQKAGASEAETIGARPPGDPLAAQTRPRPALKMLAERLPLWRRPGYLIRRLHQIHYALFFEECAAFGITPVQYGLLTILSTNPDSDQVTLANALGIDRTNVADVLRRLEQGGLIDRRRNAEDRRMVLARLTPAGEEMVEQMHPSMARAQERLLSALGEGERDAFLAMLMRLLEANNRYGRAPLKAGRGDGL
ncbi:MAG: MarR family transcriptional regulator [Rhizobiales bacterium]|nr:MarR family transcriptional regulator [Hyphomicrobiales bacterium]